FDHIRDRILTELRVVERQRVDLLVVRAEIAHLVHDLHEVLHGYPIAEQNLMKIMNEVSYLGAHDEEINTLTFDDPKLCKYPVAYVIEVSWWQMSDREAAGLRAYLQKGGFVIVDDFKERGFGGAGGWEIFAEHMQRALPGVRFFEMQASHPIFHTFFEIDTLDI